MKQFTYRVGVDWTGNNGSGTSTKAFGRDNEISTDGKATIGGSAPAEFGGDGVSWAPEDLFVGAVGQCHMLTYLFLCARAGIVVEAYSDRAVGTLGVDGASGRFVEIVLRPTVVISAGDPAAAQALHEAASAGCYVGGSVSCPIRVAGTVTMAD